MTDVLGLGVGLTPGIKKTTTKLKSKVKPNIHRSVGEMPNVNGRRRNTELSLIEMGTAVELLAEGYSQRAVGRELGVNKSTINVLAEQNREQIAIRREAYNIEIADALEDLARRSLASITDDKLNKSTAYQAALIAAIALDKRNAVISLGSVSDHKPVQNLTLVQVNQREDELKGELSSIRNAITQMMKEK